LTSDIIHSIFTQYPGVYAAFQDHVPDKLTEKEFWKKYFSSKYFHRNRVSQSKQAQEQDIFSSYMSLQDDTLPHPANLIFDLNTISPLVNLDMTEQDHGETGNAPDSTMKAGRIKESLPMIRKFNRHSQLILRETTGNDSKEDRIKKQKLAHQSSTIRNETVLDDLQTAEPIKYVQLNIKDPSKYFDRRMKVEASSPLKSSGPTLEDTSPSTVLSQVFIPF
jgi:transcription initiation factor TFIIH subunit 1